MQSLDSVLSIAEQGALAEFLRVTLGKRVELPGIAHIDEAEEKPSVSVGKARARPGVRKHEALSVASGEDEIAESSDSESSEVRPVTKKAKTDARASSGSKRAVHGTLQEFPCKRCEGHQRDCYRNGFNKACSVCASARLKCTGNPRWAKALGVPGAGESVASSSTAAAHLRAGDTESSRVVEELRLLRAAVVTGFDSLRTLIESSSASRSVLSGSMAVPSVVSVDAESLSVGEIVKVADDVITGPSEVAREV